MSKINPDESALWGTEWPGVPMKFLADCSFWGHYATWLVEGYVIAESDINAGQHLSIGPAHGAWSGAIDTARRLCAKLTGSEASIWQEWFKRLKEETSEEGEWFKNIKKNMKSMIAARKARLGERFDNSAEDIFLKEVEALCASYAKLDGADAAGRKFAINTLWRAAGRAGEPTHLSYSTLRWNGKEQTPEIESFQSKPSKMKYS